MEKIISLSNKSVDNFAKYSSQKTLHLNFYSRLFFYQ